MLLLFLLVAGPVLAAPPARAAGVRYASPTGTAAHDCLTPATACSIDKAINSALANDEVQLAPGSYSTAVALSNSGGLNVHGTAGQPRPLITTSAVNGLVLLGDGVHLSDVAIEHTGAASGVLLYSANSLTERVQVRSAGSSACTLGLSGLTRDTLCVATAPGGAAVDPSFGGSSAITAEMRNVTAVATGAGGVGLRSNVNGIGAGFMLDARNVIAVGTTDVERNATGGATVTITLQNSNFSTVSSSGPGSLTSPGTPTNQTAEPVFADTVRYHQAATSPTVDAGAVDPALGPSDLDGEARVRGKAPDIGVDEFPTDTTAPDTTIGKAPKKKTFKQKARFTFSATEPGSTFLCMIDRKPATPCTSPYKKKVRKRGKHTFTVRAVDAVGNVDATPATVTWKLRKRPS